MKDSGLPWAIGTTYVVGHQRPDTDAIGSALGYAWFLTNVADETLREPKAVAACAGQPGAQTQFALDYFRQPTPFLLTIIAPVFGHAASALQTLNAVAPLSDALALLSQGARIVPVLDDAKKPLGAVTPLGVAQAFGKTASLQHPSREYTVSLPVFSAQDRLSDYRTSLLRSEVDDFLVVGGGGEYLGVVTRGCVYDPPRARLILVDHNELMQAVPGADEAEIVSVLDHHRLGNAPTAQPIPFTIEPVGSCSTLVAERCRTHGLEPPAGIAGMLLSGLLSDTLVFRSPTTTDRDRDIAHWLAKRAGVALEEYGASLLQASPGLGTRAAADIVNGDRKRYEMDGQAVSVAQVEVTSLQEMPPRKDDLLAAMLEIREREGLSLLCLMVSDVVYGRSHLLCQGETRLLALLPFDRVDAHEFDLHEMISRKKQLVPALTDALKDG
jgi:manganese-dependent inorganic pyrophosphatase